MQHAWPCPACARQVPGRAEAWLRRSALGLAQRWLEIGVIPHTARKHKLGPKPLLVLPMKTVIIMIMVFMRMMMMRMRMVNNSVITLANFITIAMMML